MVVKKTFMYGFCARVELVPTLAKTEVCVCVYIYIWRCNVRLASFYSTYM